MRPVFDVIYNRKSADFIQCQCRIARQPFVFRGNFPRAVLEPPRWVCKDAGELVLTQKILQILCRACFHIQHLAVPLCLSQGEQ